MVSKGCFIIKAFFLCFFLGIFGAHRLYMKDYLTFFLYFLTVGYCGLGVIIDDILILFCFNFNSKEEKDISKIAKYYKFVTFYGRIVFAILLVGGLIITIIYTNYIYNGLWTFFGIGLLVYYSFALINILIVFCCTCRAKSPRGSTETGKTGSIIG